jgi:DNA polymerase-3 subunit gamma/tau
MEIISQLEKIVKQEKINVDKEVLFSIAKSSEGSLRDAESILDQLVAFSKERVSLKDVITILGLVEQDILFDITDRIIAKDSRGALGLLDRLIEEGKDIGVFLNNLIEHFRNLMIAKVTKADAKLIDLPQDICDRLLEQGNKLSLEDIFTTFNILANTQEMARRLDSLRIPLEVSLIRLATDKKGTDYAEIKQNNIQAKGTIGIDRSPVKGESAGAKIEINPPVSGPTTNITLDNIKAVWSNLIDSLSRIKMSVATYLSEGDPLAIQGNVLTVSFPKSHSLHKESLERKENKEIIEKILEDVLSVSLRVNFILSAEAKQKQEQPGSHFIKSVMDTFHGRLIKED